MPTNPKTFKSGKPKRNPFIKEPYQYSLIPALFKADKRETELIETLIAYFKDIKWLSSKLQHCDILAKNLTISQARLSKACQVGSTIIYKLSRRNSHYKALTEAQLEEMLVKPFTNGSFSEYPTSEDCYEHSIRSSVRFSGIVIAYKDLLKPHVKDCELIKTLVDIKTLIY